MNYTRPNDPDYKDKTEDYLHGSKTWCLSSDPKKIEIEELTEDELEMYNSSNKFVGLFF